MIPVLVGSLALAYLSHRKMEQIADDQRRLREDYAALTLGQRKAVEAAEALKLDAAALDQAIRSSHADPVLRSAWGAWYARLLRSPLDDLSLSNLRREMGGWQQRWARMTGRDVRAPQPQARVGQAPAAKPGGIASMLPWYGWLGVGAAVVGAGYVGWRLYKRGEAQRDALFAKYDTTRMLRAGDADGRNPLRVDSYAQAMRDAPHALGALPMPGAADAAPASRLPQYALSRRDEWEP